MKKRKGEIKDPKWENHLSHRRPYIWHRPGKGVLETRIEQIEEATGLSRKQFMKESKEKDWFIREKDLVAYMVAVDPKNPMRRVKGITWYEYGMRDMIRTILSMSRRIDELEKKFEKGDGKQGVGKKEIREDTDRKALGSHGVQRGYHHLEQALRGRGAGEKFSDLELAARRAAARLQRRRSRPSGTGITRNQQIEIDRAETDPSDD